MSDETLQQTSYLPSVSEVLYEVSDFQIESVHADKRRGRTILTELQAQDIFKHKPTEFAQDRTKAGVLARFYGVSVKTIRDVWVGRTWYRATFHMDHAKPFAPERLEKKAGRPKGSKDRKPRSCLATRSDASDIDPLSETGDQVGNNTCAQGWDDKLRHAPSCACPVSAVKDAFTWGDADNRSWANFPMIISSSSGFEDPFREDWELALQCNELVSWDGDWIGVQTDQGIGAGHLSTADESVPDRESFMSRRWRLCDISDTTCDETYPAKYLQSIGVPTP